MLPVLTERMLKGRMQLVVDAVVHVIEILVYFDLNALTPADGQALQQNRQVDKGDMTFGCVIVFSQMFCNAENSGSSAKAGVLNTTIQSGKRKYRRTGDLISSYLSSFLSLVVRSISTKNVESSI